ncbi:patatin [Nitritalea halalkaliphila LW7]|uniref:Patatin n=1 Tax=Nitritalea halalkaliphila LW7 TaxID=1189621 RepID=I5C938_9BACT|nr:patatin-like phospholipase family protein [Nitritalea halalkaliphila]EIM78340.1 patatin [Nitritalea halalkaliphila LW7]
MLRFVFVLLLLLTAVFFAGTAKDLTPADSSLRMDRPRVGLVLSGGGAKGFAHIEVLREMERAGIRPDYIAGTSMGAVVGGLYASGYSVDELEDIVRTGDWGLITSNRVRFNEIAFEEKEYYNRYLVELPIVDWRLQLPTGLIEGQELSQLLHRLTWPVKDVVDFDALPIPFRAVATDASRGVRW